MAGRIILLVTLAAFSAGEVKAYTDPGTAAILWQAAVAALVGLAFYSRRALKWFRGKSDSDQ